MPTRSHDAPAAAESPSPVAHLLELGYEDPREVAAARAEEANSRDAPLAGAQSRMSAGDLDAALAELHALIEQHAQWPAPRQLLARVHMRRKDLAAASEALHWLELHGVEHAELSLMRAGLELRRRNFDAALDHAQYARSLHAPLPAADAIIGEVHFRRGQLEAADAAYQRALAASAQHAPALSGLAAIRLRLRDYAASIDYALQALELDLNLTKTHYRLGLALTALDRQLEAAAALEMVVKLNPQLAGPHRFLARIFEAVGDPRAAEHRDRARVIISQRHMLRRRGRQHTLSSGPLPLTGRAREG